MTPCRIPGCPRPSRACGLCAAHYRRLRRESADQTSPVREPAPPRVRVSLRVSEACAGWVATDRDRAREVLERAAASDKPWKVNTGKGRK